MISFVYSKASGGVGTSIEKVVPSSSTPLPVVPGVCRVCNRWYLGMDPYIEQPNRWIGFHNNLAGEIQERLNQELPAGYYAALEPVVTYEVIAVTAVPVLSRVRLVEPRWSASR